jgi:hypothetical protein
MSQDFSQSGAQQSSADSLRERFQQNAGEFSRNLEEAANRLGGAAQHLLSITEVFTAAGDRLEQALETHRQMETASQSAAQDARDAASEARTASDRAHDAQRATEALQTRLESSYNDLTLLIRDLQERIAALAILARPMPVEPPPSPSAPSEEHAGPSLSELGAVWPSAGWTPESLQRSDS